MTGITWGSGHNRKQNTATREHPAIARLKAENARRVKCAHCDLRILPENMDRHVWLCHEW